MSSHERVLRVAILGGGTVGSSVVQLLLADPEEWQSRVGARLEVTGVAVRDASRAREGIPAHLITTDAESLARSGADLVVELIGGIEPARSLILAAMQAGSSVITANKALLAEDGASLYRAAAENGVDLYFEAPAGIPLWRSSHQGDGHREWLH